VTQEGWLLRPTVFLYINTIELLDMEIELGNQFWPEDSACYDGSNSDGIVTSEETLQDWIKLIPDINKHSKVLV
jgi:hypothetical protein